MSGIDLVLFDLDDVLVDYNHETHCQTLGDRIGRGAMHVHDALFGSGLARIADVGRIDPAGVARTLSQTLGTPVSVADCVAARAASMHPRHALTPLVEALSTRLRLAVLTNNGLLVRDHFAVLCPLFAPYFEGHVHCSAMYGLGKPDPMLFRRCAEALGTPPERILFIDDKPENARGAEQAGMLGHHYRDPIGLRRTLLELDLLETRPHAP